MDIQELKEALKLIEKEKEAEAKERKKRKANSMN
jgi:hypothetical protein